MVGAIAGFSAADVWAGGVSRASGEASGMTGIGLLAADGSTGLLAGGTATTGALAGKGLLTGNLDGNGL